MRTSSLARGPLLITEWNFSGRITQTHADFINGPLSKRASGPFYEVRAIVLSFSCEHFPSRALRALTFVLSHRKRGPKDIPAPFQKSGGAMTALLPPPIAAALACRCFISFSIQLAVQTNIEILNLSAGLSAPI